MGAKTIAELGYKTVEELSRNHRFVAVKLERDGRYFFGKTAQNEERWREIENEVWWYLTCQRLNEAVPSLLIRSPKVITLGQSWYVSEYFDYPVLLPRDRATAELLRPHINRLTAMLLKLDSLLVVKGDKQPLYENSNSAPYTNLLNKVDGWMVEPLAQKIITIKRINQAKRLIEKYRESIKPGLQHGDFVPWHMFAVDESITGLIDSEHSSLVKPRYYDLAYLYTRIFTRLNACPEAGQILEKFVSDSKINQQDFLAAFLPVVTLRALGMHTDAIVELPRRDFRKEASHLLDLCFEENLEALIKF